MSKKISGTKEWAKTTINIIKGCSNDCLYCYAREMAVRFKSKTNENWKDEELNYSVINKEVGKRNGTIMFPSTHDITEKFIDESIYFIEKLLKKGNNLLIVSKPRPFCITKICNYFKEYKDQIQFRFTIGSCKDDTLSLWEPNAPLFKERLKALKTAHKAGFKTSISCEPMLDDSIPALIKKVRPFVTDSIWLGKMNKINHRVKDQDKSVKLANEVKKLIELQSNDNIQKLYDKYKDDELIKWKESIKEVVGIDLSKTSGEDV